MLKIIYNKVLQIKNWLIFKSYPTNENDVLVATPLNGKKILMSIEQFRSLRKSDKFYLNRVNEPSVYYHNGQVEWYFKNQLINAQNQKDFNMKIKLLCLK